MKQDVPVAVAVQAFVPEERAAAQPPPRKRGVVLVAAMILALFLGILVGFFVGRATLEAQWSRPLTRITPADHQRSSGNDADPTPPEGASVFKAIPLGRMRAEVKKYIEKDPVQVTLTSFGNGDQGSELHLVMRNDAGCKIVAYSGVVYAFDAHGKPVKANKGGEPYVAFTSEAAGDKVAIAPRKNHIHSQKLRYPETASIGVAHVDGYSCDDGTKWARQ